MVSGSTSASAAARTIRLRITRQDGPGKASRIEEFSVPVQPGANIISCLQTIASNPVTADGRRTTPVAWDANCLEEVCGACTMVINGRVRQSCSCLIDEYAPNDGDVISLEPMGKFPVVRDLFVDRSRLFENLKKVKAWVPVDGTWDLGGGPKVSPAVQNLRYRLSECMSCGCCLEACPQFLEDNDFVGANTFGQALLFNRHPVGADLAPARLDALLGPGGINDCGNAQNCVKVCPKNIPLTEAIAEIGRETTVHALKSFFSGR